MYANALTRPAHLCSWSQVHAHGWQTQVYCTAAMACEILSGQYDDLAAQVAAVISMLDRCRGSDRVELLELLELLQCRMYKSFIKSFIGKCLSQLPPKPYELRSSTQWECPGARHHGAPDGAPGPLSLPVAGEGAGGKPPRYLDWPGRAARVLYVYLR